MNLRRFLILLGLLGVTILLVTTFSNPTKILLAFEQVRWYVVPLVIVTQMLSYYCNARYYQAYFKIAGRQVDLRRLYETSLAINFANQVIPSGGIAGAAYLTQSVKKYDVTPGNATLAQLGRYVFTFLSYFLVLAVGFVLLFMFGTNLNQLSVRFTLLLMVVLLLGGIVVLMVLSERSRLETVLWPIVRMINRFGQSVLRRSKPLVHRPRIDGFLTEFYRGYHDVLNHKGKWPSLLWWTLGGNIAEVLTLYCVFIGFGYWINPGIVITAYTLAIIASVGGIIINGLGIYEAGMIGAFAALGVPAALAFAITIVYRVLSLAIFLPIGLYFYRKHLKELQ